MFKLGSCACHGFLFGLVHVISLLTILLLNLQLFVVGKERERHKEIVTRDHEGDLHTII